MSDPDRANTDAPFKLEGSCHCGAVRWTLTTAPKHLTECTCSICRRVGARWIHAEAEHIALSYEPSAVTRYVQGSRSLAMVSCKACGCTTHWEPEPEQRPVDPSLRMAVNARMADPAELTSYRTRTFDGAETWTFLD